MKEEYYAPREIKYSQAQVRWLLRNVLFQDSWPSDNKETGYTGGKGRTAGHFANFETIRMIIGELNARLKMCGKAGLYLEYLTLVDYGDKDYLASRLAGYHGTTPEEVLHLAGMALCYCCGNRRKKTSFREFCNYTNYRERKRRGT
jgi:hypothetical protein